MLASFASNAYFYVALGSTIFFALQSIFTFIGIGDNFELDGDFDAELDADVGIGDGLSMTFHLFTVRGIIAFFMVFGWSGFILDGSMHGVAVFFTSVGTGVIMLVIVGLIYYLFQRLEQSGTMDIKEAIGKQGSVYIPVPNRNDGLGKVQIIIGESLRTLDAIAKDKPIKTGRQVRVIGIINEMLEVEEIEEGTKWVTY